MSALGIKQASQENCERREENEDVLLVIVQVVKNLQPYVLYFSTGLAPINTIVSNARRSRKLDINFIAASPHLLMKSCTLGKLPDKSRSALCTKPTWQIQSVYTRCMEDTTNDLFSSQNKFAQPHNQTDQIHLDW